MSHDLSQAIVQIFSSSYISFSRQCKGVFEVWRQKRIRGSREAEEINGIKMVINFFVFLMFKKLHRGAKSLTT